MNLRRFYSPLLVGVPTVAMGCGALGMGTPARMMDTSQPIEAFIASNFEDAERKGEQAQLHRGVLYSAPLTSVNTIYVRKPHKDLTTFCTKQLGSLVRVRAPNDKLLKQLLGAKGGDERLLSPMQAAVNAKAMAARQNISEPMATQIAEGVARDQAQANRQALARRQEETRYTVFEDGYPMLARQLVRAMREGHVGQFECQLEGEKIWQAGIEPEKFYKGLNGGNELDTSKLLFRISGIQGLVDSGEVPPLQSSHEGELSPAGMQTRAEQAALLPARGTPSGAEEPSEIETPAADGAPQ